MGLDGGNSAGMAGIIDTARQRRAGKPVPLPNCRLHKKAYFCILANEISAKGATMTHIRLSIAKPGTGKTANEIANKSATQRAELGAVLAKATGRAAALLGLNGVALAQVIGVSEATVSRVSRGDRPLLPDSKEGELAALLVRLYRSLDALVGNDEASRLAWMRSHNDALGGTPATLILSVQGLVSTVAYLDSMRAPV
jgi:hypothetical protein